MISENALKSFTGKNVLVTGGTGLIGRQIVNTLCDADTHVKKVSLDKININDKAERKNRNNGLLFRGMYLNATKGWRNRYVATKAT